MKEFFAKSYIEMARELDGKAFEALSRGDLRQYMLLSNDVYGLKQKAKRFMEV